MHYNSAGGWLKPVECIQDKALIISVVVPSELATCSRHGNFWTFMHSDGVTITFSRPAAF
jgi:hypothetical protein